MICDQKKNPLSKKQNDLKFAVSLKLNSSHRAVSEVLKVIWQIIYNLYLDEGHHNSSAITYDPKYD